MNYSDTYGNYLRAADLQGRKHRLTIGAARVESFNKTGAATGEKVKKLVIGFDETAKELICAPTNARILADAFTNDTDKLIGQAVEIEPYMTNMGLAIRVTVPAQRATAKPGDLFAAAVPTPAVPGELTRIPAADFDDDIPL